MSAVRRALLFSTGERYLTLATNFLLAGAVSRILTPAEIGVSIVGMAVIGIAISLREFASASFLIQQKEVSREDVRRSFSVSLALTLLIILALAGSAPALASAYGEKNLVPYLHLVCVCLFVDLFFGQVVTLLRREIAFANVAVINLSGAVAGAVATVLLALLGFSYMSFAWGWLASSVVSGLVALSRRPHFWMFRPLFTEWHQMMRFGGYHGGTVLLYKLYEMLPYLLIGRTDSPGGAALFSRGSMICQIPDKVILGGAIPVLLPAFADAVRAGRSLKKPYLHALEITTVLYWPALIVLAALAHPVVDLIFGSQWHDVVPLVRIMAVATLFSFSFELNYPVMVSMGAIRESFMRALIAFPASAVILGGAILLGGLQAAVWSMMIIIPFQALVALTFVLRRLAIGWAEIWRAVRKSGIVAALSVAGPLAVGGMQSDMSVLQAAVAVVLALAGWSLGLLVTRHPFIEEIGKFMPAIRRSVVPHGALAALPKE